MNPRKLALVLSRRDPIAAVSEIADKREVAKILVDRSAEAARARFVTNTPSQSGVYEMKAAEAAACQTVLDGGGAPDPSAYPHLAAEVGITAPDLAGVAAVILSMRATWTAASAAIEGLRLGAKAVIGAASSETDIRAALVVAWPKPDQE